MTRPGHTVMTSWIRRRDVAGDKLHGLEVMRGQVHDLEPLPVAGRPLAWRWPRRSPSSREPAWNLQTTAKRTRTASETG